MAYELSVLKCRLVGLGLLAVGVSAMLTGHTVITYFTGIVTGLYLAGMAIAFFEKLTGEVVKW